MKNYIYRSFFLTLIVVISLLLLGLVPQIRIGSFTTKPIDILSDIRIVDSLAVDTTLFQPILPDSCKVGMFCIEDYSTKKTALKRFSYALDSANRKAVRIAFIGDSFIEGDILTEDLREGLQDEFGGRGVGFVPLTTVLAGARQTVGITSQAIRSHWLVDSTCIKREAGIAGSYYHPLEGAFVSYRGSKFRRYVDTFSTVRVLYQSKSAINLKYIINKDGEQGSFTLPHSPLVGLERVAKGNIGQVLLSFAGAPTDKLKLFGVLLEDTKGVYVDNFAMRGNSGYALLNVPQEVLRTTDSLLSYRLIVLQSGLNVLGSSGHEKNFTGYRKQLLVMVERLKVCFPNADILIMGVSDRSRKKGGEYITNESVPYLISAQREVAAQAGVAFWDTFTAMGGENSMPELVKAKPPKAAKDYTHISFEGGRFIGEKLLEALLYEKEKYDARKPKPASTNVSTKKPSVSAKPASKPSAKKTSTKKVSSKKKKGRR